MYCLDLAVPGRDLAVPEQDLVVSERDLAVPERDGCGTGRVWGNGTCVGEWDVCGGRDGWRKSKRYSGHPTLWHSSHTLRKQKVKRAKGDGTMYV
jgi:hypothetical protein